MIQPGKSIAQLQLCPKCSGELDSVTPEIDLWSCVTPSQVRTLRITILHCIKCDWVACCDCRWSDEQETT